MLAEANKHFYITTEPMTTLAKSKLGEQVRIKNISCHDDIKRHLASLGFAVGENILIVSKFAGNIILKVKGSRIAIDKTMADQILIQQ